MANEMVGTTAVRMVLMMDIQMAGMKANLTAAWLDATMADKMVANSAVPMEIWRVVQ